MRMVDRTKTSGSDKQAAILETTLKLLSERGFHDTPMSLIAQEAGVGTGTIYRYFESKDALINELFLTLERHFMEDLLTGLASEGTLEEKICRTWRNTFHYCIQNREAMAFLEQYKNSPFQTPEIKASIEPYFQPVMSLFEEGVASGEIKEMPFEMFTVFNFDIIMACAKRHISGALVMDEANLELVVQACWDAVKAA